MDKVIEERAADPTMAAVPRGKTGLLVRRVKSFGRGKHRVVVEEYVVDIKLLKQFRETLKQAAQEIGQWGHSHDITSRGEPLPLILGVSACDIDY